MLPFWYHQGKDFMSLFCQNLPEFQNENCHLPFSKGANDGLPGDPKFSLADAMTQHHNQVNKLHALRGDLKILTCTRTLIEIKTTYE